MGLREDPTPKHILVVDDDKPTADFTAMAIQKLGGDGLTAEAIHGGKACLNRLGKEPQVDLIMLDLNMPEPNGADVIRTLVKQNPLPSLKILITSAWGPGWIEHWNLTDIHQTAAFKQLILGTCDKADTMQEMVDQIRKRLGLPDSEHECQ